MGFQGGISGKESTANAGDTKEVQFLSPKDPMELEVATTHYSCLEIPLREESSRLQSMGPQRIRHN